MNLHILVCKYNLPLKPLMSIHALNPVHRLCEPFWAERTLKSKSKWNHYFTLIVGHSFILVYRAYTIISNPVHARIHWFNSTWWPDFAWKFRGKRTVVCVSFEAAQFNTSDSETVLCWDGFGKYYFISFICVYAWPHVWRIFYLICIIGLTRQFRANALAEITCL